jgi:hypothetical protein
MAAVNHMRASRREDHRAHLTRRVLVPMYRAEQPQRDTRQGKLRLAGMSRRGSTGAWGVGRVGSMATAAGVGCRETGCSLGALAPAVAAPGSGRPKWPVEVRSRLRAA